MKKLCVPQIPLELFSPEPQRFICNVCDSDFAYHLWRWFCAEFWIIGTYIKKTLIFPLLFLNLRSLCIFSSFWPIKLSDPHKYIFGLNVGLCGFGNQLMWCWTIPWRMFLQAAVIEDYLLFDLGLIFFKNKINIFI